MKHTLYNDDIKQNIFDMIKTLFLERLKYLYNSVSKIFLKQSVSIPLLYIQKRSFSRAFLNTVLHSMYSKTLFFKSVFEYRATSIDTFYRSGNCVGNSLKASLWHTLKSA